MRGRLALAGALLTELLAAVAILGPVAGAAVAGGVALLTAGRGPLVARQVLAAAAAIAVGIAAVATVVEAPLGSGWNLTFASARPTARWAAGVAAALATASVVLTVAILPPRRPATSSTGRRGGARGAAVRGALSATTASLALAVVAAVALRLALGPTVLDGAVARTAANVANGVGYRNGVPGDRAVAPLVPVLLLVSGLGARALGALAAAGVAAGAGVLRPGVGRRRLALGALLAGVLPSTWSQPAPVLVASALVAGGLAMALRERAGPSARALGGALLGAAVLADPTTVLAGVLVGGWLVAQAIRARDRWTGALAHVLAYAGMLLLVLAGARATATASGTWWRSGGPLGDPGAAWLVVDALVGAAALVAVWTRRAPALLGAVALVAGAAGLAGRDGTSLWGWGGAALAVAAAACVDPRPAAA